MNKSHPPLWADRLLEWFCDPHLLEEVQGDLHELYGQWVEQHGLRKAKWLYIVHSLKFLRPYSIKRLSVNNPTAMFKNYFIIAYRNLWRHKIFSFINIAGLSIGLACCMLIFLYAKDEITFDRFHKKQHQIYRLTALITDPEGSSDPWKSGSTGMVQGEAFKNEIPEIEKFVRLKEFTFIIRKEGEVFNESALYADSNFFSVFSFPLLQGNPETALRDIHSVVLTEELALKYFGTTDVLGKNLALGVEGEFENFVVTGVAEKAPQNSTIKFSILLPFAHYAGKHPDEQWLNFFLNTFVVLHPEADVKAVESKMAKVFKKNAREQIAEAAKNWGFNNQVTFGLQPLADLHLNTAWYLGNGLVDGSNPIYAYVLSAIAVFILFIACINFVNLTVAQSLKRSKEIGIRKVAGGMRKQLIIQFLGESFVICLLAFTLAILLAQWVLPFFNQLAHKKLSLSYLLDTDVMAGSVTLLLITTLAAGFYPALVLSGFQPVKVLYGKQKLTSKNYFAKSLVVVQFALATFLIIGTIAIYSQFHFLIRKDLGFEDDNLVSINLPWWEDNGKVLELFKNQLADQSSIVRIAGKSGGRYGTNVKANGKEMGTDYIRIDENYFPTLQIPLIEGRNFSQDFPSDTIEAVIVNEAFVKEAGWKEPIGQTVDFFTKQQKKVVIGVVKDYHFRSLKEKIGPQLFFQYPDVKYGQIWVKIRPDDIPQTLELLEETYRQLVPFYPYEYQFMATINARQYETEAKWKQIIQFAAILSVFISCMGLFGLTTLGIEQRTKEIGIRKVLGASVSSIVTLLSKDFVKLVVIAFFIAIPLGYFAVDQWLQNFAYRIEISGWIFIVVGLLALLIALFTISFQSVKAALSNPVNSLRNE